MQPSVMTKLSFILWLIGVPAAGKSTIARELVSRLGDRVELIDSDDLRARLTPDPEWSNSERQLFYRALWEIAQRLARRNTPSVIAASGGGIDLDLFRATSVVPVWFAHVDCDLESASERRGGDLYRAASSGTIRLPLVRVRQGVANVADLAFCRRQKVDAYDLLLPETIDIVLDGLTSVEDNVAKLCAYLKEHDAIDE